MVGVAAVAEVAAVTMAVVGVTMAVAARHYGGGGGKRNYGHRNYGHRNYGYRNYGYRGYRGGRWYGGRWWGYGVGTCWRWTPGGYIWICGY